MKKNKKEAAEMEDSEKRIKVSTLAYAIIIVLVVVFALLCGIIYRTQSQTGENIAAFLSKIVPLPAAAINGGNFVMLSDLEKNTDALVKFYQSPEYLQSGAVKYDFSSADGKKQVEIMKKYILNKMIQDKAVEILATKRNITVSQSDIKDFMDQKMQTYATQDDVTNMLRDSYGWTLDDFTKMVVVPSVRLAELQSEVTKNELNNDDAENKITAARDALAGGADFATVAEQYSEGASKDKGGELGWVNKSDMIPELQAAIFSDNPPKQTDIIESSIGYHLVDIEGEKKENNTDVVQFRQIFVAKKTFSDWLSDQMKGMHIVVPLGEFNWDSNAETVSFSSKDMQQFEASQLSSPTGIAANMLQ